MVKRRLTVFVIAVMALCLFFAVGCSEKAPPEQIFTVVLDANGGQFDDGEAVKSFDVTNGDMLQAPRPTKTDYDFLGWYSDSNATSAQYDFSATPITSSGTYYAGWAPNAFAVTFMLNYAGAPNGGVYRTDKVAKGGTVNKPVDPDRDDYTFIKWTSDEDGEEEWDFSTDTVRSEVTLYAQWESETVGEVLTEITITTPPTKTSYVVGQSFDPAGMVVKAVYDSGRSVEITNYTVEYDFSAPNAEAVVKVKYAGKEATLTVTVAAREVVSVALTGTPSKTFAVGSLFDTTGLTFTATYNDGTSEMLSSADITYSSPALDADGKFKSAGEAVITFMYGDITVTPTLTVTVADEEIPSDEIIAFAVSGTLTKFEYNIGEKFDPAGLTFTAEYTLTGSVSVEADRVSFSADGLASDGSFIKTGTITITASFDGMTADGTITVTVADEVIPSDELIAFAVSGTLTKSEYNIGEKFDPAGLTFTATYETSGVKSVDVSEVRFTAAELDEVGKFISAGAVHITASFGGMEADGTIDVIVTIPETLAEGYYLLGDFNDWNNGTVEELAVYKLTENTYDGGNTLSMSTEVAIKLGAGDNFKIVKYTPQSGAYDKNSGWDWDGFIAPSVFNINPASALTLIVDAGNNNNINVSSILNPDIESWYLEYLIKKDGTSTTYELTARLKGYDGWYISMRSPVLGGAEPTEDTANSADVYVKGNFTGEWKATKAWSNKSDVITVDKTGNVYTFNNVYLKQYDSFKMYITSTDAWWGLPTSTVFALDTKLKLTSDGSAPNICVGKITDGYYDIEFDTSGYITVRAHVNKYTVTFDKNISYTAATPAAQTVAEGGLIDKPVNLKVNGYTFLGWFKEIDCVNEWNFDEDTVSKNTTLYAGWASKTITIVYINTDTEIANGTWTAVNEKNGDFPEFVISEVGVKAHYIFVEWKLGDKAVTSLTHADIPSDGNTITLTASYRGEEFTVSFETEEGEPYTAWANGFVAPAKHVYGTETPLPVSANLALEEGYTFLGWYRKGDVNKTKVLAVSADIFEDVTYVIILENNVVTYEFSFDLNYEGAPAADPDHIDVAENEKASKPADPVREHYDFGGWYKSADCKEEDKWNFDVDTVTGPTTVYAKWTPKQYLVTFDENVENGEVIGMPESLSAPYGSTIERPEQEPTREYYDFGGWYKDAKCETEWNFETDKVEGPTTLYAKWTLVKYDVTFNGNKPSDATGSVTGVPSSVKVERGSTVNKPTTEPKLTGYTFDGWYKDAEGKTAWKFTGETNADTVTAPVELFAKWTEQASDGFYILGTINGWNTDFSSGANKDYYMAPQSGTGSETIDGVKYTTKSYVVTGIDLAGSKGDAGRFAEFKIVTYTASTNKVDWHSDDNTSNDWYPSGDSDKCKFDISVTPSDMLGVYLYHNVRNIVVQDYNVEKTIRWTLTYVEKTKTGESSPSKFELVISPDNYNDYREIEGTASGTPSVYLAGNFTGGFALKPEWSNVNADVVFTEGKVYTFRSVPLKKYDTFKVVTKSGTNDTWLGGTFSALGTAFNVTSSGANIYLKTITDGLYNVVVDASSTTVKVTIYKAEEVTVSLNKDIYVGDVPTANDVDVYASGVKVAAGKFTLIATAAVEGENNSSLTVKYNGTVVTITYTAISLEVTEKALTKKPSKITYNVGDSISLDGVIVTLTYNSGKKESAQIDDLSYNCAAATEGKLLTAGEEYTVEVMYKGEKVGEYTITVNNVITSLTVTANDGVTLEFVQNAAAPALKNLITVKANYNEDVDGATPVEPTLVTEYTVSSIDMATVGPQVIKVTYNGAEGSIEITIVAPTVTSVEASGSLNKTEYFVGDEFEPNGITFTVHYNNGKSEVVSYEEIQFTSDFIEDTKKFNKSGVKTVSASYNGVPVTGAELNVTVEDKLTSIRITANPTKTAYYSGDTIDLDGMVLTGTYNESVPSAITTKRIESGYTTSPSLTDRLTVADTKIVVSYGGFSAEIAITVEQKKATEISIGGVIPEQYLNATLNTTGMTVTVTYNSGDKETFDASKLVGLTFESTAFGEDKTFRLSGTQTVTAKYEDVSTTFEVNVINTTKYNVEFFANAPMGTVSGALPATQQVTHGERAVDPEAGITLTGYTFDGWYTEAECINKWSFDNVIISNKQLYAKWVAKTYTVTYVLYGGNNGDNPEYYTASVDNLFAPVALENATKQHYTFDGWYTSKNYDGGKVTSISYAMLDGLEDTVTLYAKFSPVTYTVTFNYNDGATSSTVKHVVYNPESGVVARPEPNPEREGYDFVEWQKDGVSYDFGSIVEDNIELVAVWEKKTYTITFDYNDGITESTTQTVKYLEKVIRPQNPERDDYDFVEWQRDSVTYDFDTLVTGEFTLTALWKKVEKVTVTFHSNGGTDVESITIVKGTVATKPADPERVGYTFDKWYIDEGLDTEYMWNDPVNENIDLYAGWIINKYDVTFDLNYTGAPAATVVKVNYDTAIAEEDIPEDPTRDGYEFKGWYTDKNGTAGKEWVSTDRITAAVTVYAKWEKIDMADGIYANGKFVKAIVPNGDSTTEWKVENAVLYAGDKITFWRNNAQVTTNVYVRGGLDNNEMSGTSYTNIVVNTGGYFTMYYNPVNDNSKNGLWVNYNGAYVAPTLKETDGMYNGTALVGKFVVNEDGANEIMALDVRLDDKATLTVQYNGATVTTATLNPDCSLGSASGGKFTLEAGTYSFYYNYSTKVMWIDGTPDVKPADPNAGLTWGAVTSSYGWVVGKFAARSMSSFDWNNGYRMTLNGSEYQIKRLYLTSGDVFKVRAGDYYSSGCGTIRGGTNISDVTSYLKGNGDSDGNVVVVKTGYYEFYVSNSQNIWFVYSAT